MRQFDGQNCGLDTVNSAVAAHNCVLVLCRLAVVCDQATALGKVGVVRYDGSCNNVIMLQAPIELNLAPAERELKTGDKGLLHVSP